MIDFSFKEFVVKIFNESDYSESSVDNIVNYDSVYKDDESQFHQSSNHGIKIYESEKLYKSALICGVGGATGIHKNSAVIINEKLLVCCANKIFSLDLPNLELIWIKEIDSATCFQIFNVENKIFVHGELKASCINEQGDIVWSVGFPDILVTPNGENSFIIRKDFIEITDWNYDKYKITFDGKFI